MTRFKIARKELNGVLFFFCLCKALLLFFNLYLGKILSVILTAVYGESAYDSYLKFASYGTLSGLLLEIAVFTICLFLPICLYFFFSGKKYTEIIPARKPEILQICFGVGTSFVIGNISSNIGHALLSVLFSIFGMKHKYDAMLQSTVDYPENIWLVPLLCIMLAVLPGLWEEIAMRGIGQNATKKFGFTFSLLFSGFFFALLHSSWTQIPQAFVFGIVLAYFTIRFKTVWIAVISHFAFNFNSVIQCLIMQNAGRFGDFWLLLWSVLFSLTMIGFMVAGLIVYGIKFPVERSEFKAGQKIKALISSPFLYIFLALESIQLIFLLTIY